MTLKDWLESTCTTQSELARKTGIPQALLSKYALGKQRPHIDNAVAIEKATKGVVPVEEWTNWKPIAPKRRCKRKVA